MKDKKVLVIEGHIEGNSNYYKIKQEILEELELLCEKRGYKLSLMLEVQNLEDYLMRGVNED